MGLLAIITSNINCYGTLFAAEIITSIEKLNEDESFWSWLFEKSPFNQAVKNFIGSAASFDNVTKLTCQHSVLTDDFKALSVFDKN